jgi:glutathione S-transferase
MQFGTFEKRAAFERYWARLSARPAKQRADEMDNALIKRSS